VLIGGQPATVTAAQSPVGSVPGLLQLNVTVPASIAAGSAIPVLLTQPSQLRSISAENGSAAKRNCFGVNKQFCQRL
jgi:uncharacterized protein (TIGR03437 family)